MVFYEHHLAGRSATAAGSLARARRHLDAAPECPEQAFLAFADVFLAQERGDLEHALASARLMTVIAHQCGSPDLRAMGRMCEGTVLMASGDTAAGLALVDEAMCAVLAGELSALFTGWIFCLALPPCIEAADLRRAGEWTEAAMAWCDSLPAGSPFHGICRVHRVEVLHLRGVGRGGGRGWAGLRRAGRLRPAGRGRGVLCGRGDPSARQRPGRSRGVLPPRS